MRLFSSQDLRREIVFVAVALFVVLVVDIAGPTTILADVVARERVDRVEEATVTWIDDGGIAHEAVVLVPGRFEGASSLPIVEGLFGPKVQAEWFPLAFYLVAAAFAWALGGPVARNIRSGGGGSPEAAAPFPTGAM